MKKLKFILCISFLFQCISIYAEYDISELDRKMSNRSNLNIKNLNRNAKEPSLGINFFKAPKTLTNLNPIGEPMVTRSGGANIYRRTASAVVKIITDESMGSGAFISSNGEIITNWHVVEGWNTVGIYLYDQINNQNPAYLLADVIRINPKVDLALIKINQSIRNINYLKLEEKTINVGDDVHAIGHPEGNDWSYTKGYISAIRNGFQWDYYDYSDESKPTVDSSHIAKVIQTQTPINPGNSGGPLLDNNGKLIGINSFTSGSDGLNFAVSSSEIKDFLNNKEQDFGPIVDPGSYLGALDMNEDGEDDLWVWDLDDDELADVIGTDTNSDGAIDNYDIVKIENDEIIIFGNISTQEVYGNLEVVWNFDFDNDGEFEAAGIDYDRDGMPDFIKDF